MPLMYLLEPQTMNKKDKNLDNRLLRLKVEIDEKTANNSVEK